MPDQSDPLRHQAPRHLKLAGVVALCAAGLVVGAGVITRVHADQGLKDWTRAQSVPTVTLVSAGAGGDQALVLPGDVQAFSNAAIHARVSGYLKRWYVDIGTRVKAGQLLAEIDTPDLDQQVIQARADLATAEANQRLAETTSKRWAGLLAQDAVSRQEADEKAGDLAARSSAVNAAKANLNRLLALESFKRITAPFDGIVTVRSTDIGALIAAGSPSDAPLFTVADQRRLRIYVRAPQNYSALIRHGMTADLAVPEYPGQTFKAVVVGDAQAVNAQSGSLLVELQIDNADGRLKPGEYAQVSFNMPSATAATVIPATAILFQHGGPAVAVAGPDSRVSIRPIVIGRDMGATVQVASGLKPADRVIDNPPESLAQGDQVQIGAVKGAGADARKG